MNKLWIFGDSFSSYNGHFPTDDYYKYKGDGDGAWFEHLLENYKTYSLELHSYGGSSNDTIFDTIVNNFNLIKPNDRVIIGMTFNNRVSAPLTQNGPLIDYHHNKPIIQHEFTENQINILDRFIVEFRFYNNLNGGYKKQSLMRFNFLKNILINYINVKSCLIWDVHVEGNEYETIRTATDGTINDGHWSFRGHYDFYKWVLNKLRELNELT